jgi:ferredoxin-NADP reductase
MNYTAKFTDRERMGADVMLVRLQKPEGFKFIAGQFCSITVPDIGIRDDKGLRRTFSIASSPLENELLFAMKMSESALKRTIAEMPPGTNVTLEQPLGSLVLPEVTGVPLVFLAGGVGITPFRSMVRYSADAGTGHSITLFYSSQTPEETPFLEELQQISGKHRQIAAIITMTRVGEDRSRWSGLTGRVNPEMIKEGCKEWERAAYYIAGPPGMSSALNQTLQGMSIPPEKIRTELFAGY